MKVYIIERTDWTNYKTPDAKVMIYNDTSVFANLNDALSEFANQYNEILADGYTLLGEEGEEEISNQIKRAMFDDDSNEDGVVITLLEKDIIETVSCLD